MASYAINQESKKTVSFPDTSHQGKIRDVMMAIYDAGETGLTTREVADICDLSIYAARNWLLKLEYEGCIMKKGKPRNTTWHKI